MAMYSELRSQEITPSGATLESIVAAHASVPRGSAAHFRLLREFRNDPAGCAAIRQNLHGRQMNVLLPTTSVLPEEILSMVFLALADIAPPRAPITCGGHGMEQYYLRTAIADVEKPEIDKSHKMLPIFGAGPGHLGCILVAHVSGEWRDLAFRLRSFWARHIGALPNSVFEGMLYWAGNTVPVSLVTLCSTLREGGLLDVVTALQRDEKLAQRVERIQFEDTVRRPNSANCISLFKTFKFPHLTSLDISANISYDRNDDHYSVPMVDSPLLESIRLEDISLRWNSSRLVDIELIGDFAKIYVPIPLLVDMLRLSSQTLSRLHLQNCLFAAPGSIASPNIVAVHLPNLRSLFIEAPILETMFFLYDAVVIPHTANLIIDLPYEPLQFLEDVVPVFYAGLSKVVSHDGYYLGLVLSDDADDLGCKIEVYEGVHYDDGHAEKTPLLGMTAKFGLSSGTNSGLAQIGLLLGCIDHRRVTVLHLEFCQPREVEDTEAIWRSLPEVRFLHLASYEHHPGGRPDPLTLLLSSSSFLPKLEVLSVEWDWKWRHSWPWLAHRIARRGSVIHTLHIYRRLAVPRSEWVEQERQVEAIFAESIAIHWYDV